MQTYGSGHKDPYTLSLKLDRHKWLPTAQPCYTWGKNPGSKQTEGLVGPTTSLDAGK